MGVLREYFQHVDGGQKRKLKGRGALGKPELLDEAQIRVQTGRHKPCCVIPPLFPLDTPTLQPMA